MRKTRKISGYSVLAFFAAAALLPITHAHASPPTYACDDRLPTTPRCYLASGKKEEWDHHFGPAMTDLNRAIQLQPNWYEPYLERATIYAFQSHFDLAIADATKAIRLKPNDGQGYLLRGMAYGAKGLYRPAISDATRAIALGPAYRYISFGARGIALWYSGRPAAAVLDYSRAIALKGDEPGPYYSRAIAYEQMGQHHRAEADYAKALSLLNISLAATPKDGFLYQQRGLVLERTGHEDQAVADETRALALDTLGPADAHIYRGLAYDRKGLHAKAAADLQSAVRIDRYSKLEWDRMKPLDAGLAARQ